MKKLSPNFFLFLLNITSLLLLLILFLIYYGRVSFAGHYYGENDFFSFYQSMRFYFSGQNIYSYEMLANTKLHTIVFKNGNLNTPFLTLLLLPLYAFNYADALKIWTIVSLVLISVNTGLVLSAFPNCKKYILPIGFLFALYTPNSITVSYGQVSFLLMFFLSVSWLCLRKEKDVWAGVWMGLACALKLFAGLFLVYFFCVKRLRVLSSAMVTLLVIFLLTCQVFGIQSYTHYFKTLTTVGWYASNWNISFKGFFMRWFSQVEHNKVLFNAPYAAEFLTIVSSLLLLIWLVWTWDSLRRSTDAYPKHNKRNSDLGFGVTIIGMLLLSPLGWVYYFNIFLIPYLILIRQTQNYSRHLILCGLLCASMLLGDLLKPAEIKTFLQLFYNGTIGFLIVVIFIILFGRMIYETLQSDQTAAAPSENTVGKYITAHQWIIIYSSIFIPALISQGKICDALFKATTNYW